jgi:nicotinate dehydrogenase subunit B
MSAYTRDARAALRAAGVSRRDFLKTSGALIVGFSAGGLMLRAQGPQGQRPASGQLDSWLAIGADGQVTAYTGKCELGQGMQTSQIQLIAEELSVPVGRVRIVQCDTALCSDQGTTSGSQSHPTNFNERNLAQAGATAREALMNLAAARLGVPAGELTAADGVISVTREASKKVSYGDLVGGRKFNVPLNPEATRKPMNAWKILGTSVPRVDMAAMATGTLEYVHNVRVPGMLHGVVVRPPEVGARLVNVDRQSVAALPGVVQVVVKNSFVAVVAEKPWQAIQAAARLKATWTPGTGLPAQASFYDYLRSQPSRATFVVNSGDVDQKLQDAATTLKATYFHPYQMHGSIGSSCAVADVKDGRATIWSSSQAVFGVKSAAATMLGLKPEDVHVIFTRGSGCYGINGADTVSYDAALMSQAVGRPVRVQLSRKDEMAWENYGFAYAIDERAGLDAAGNIVAWDHQSWSATTSQAMWSPACWPVMKRRRFHPARSLAGQLRSTTARTRRRRT